MTKDTFLRLCLSALLPTAEVQAQDVMYVHSAMGCQALEVRNVVNCSVFGSACWLCDDQRYNLSDIDSITFERPRDKRVVRRGWWGDLTDGRFSCYYQSADEQLPDLAFLAADGVCETAACFLPADDGDGQVAEARRRVGRKWRYVKNTLSGHRKFSLSIFDDLPYGGYDASIVYPDNRPGSGVWQIDLTPLFRHHATGDVRSAVSYWYRRDKAVPQPSLPVFGHMTDSRHYEVALTPEPNPVRCVVALEYAYNGIDNYVESDSIYLVFRSEEEAQREFALMDTRNDEYASFFLNDNVICIREKADATYEEAMRRLVRFDIDLCRPVFIREEE